MSLLLNQPSLCVPKPLLVRSSPLLSNNAFSTSLPQTLPSCTRNLTTFTPRAHKVPKEGWIARMVLPISIMCVDPCRPNLTKSVRSREDGIEAVPSEWEWIIENVERYGMIGSSNGLPVYLKDGKMRLRDFKNRQEPKDIMLPPLVTLPLCQTHMVTNVAMSSSSPQEDECVLAVKFLGPQLSFCRPARSKPEWINVRIENPSFFSSRVMFSKKDEMFHIVGSGGHLIGSWDLHGEHTSSKFRKLRFQNLPEISKTKRELLDTCCTSEHLVESPSMDETFMVKWFKKTVATDAEHGINRMETIALMVFKLDEEGNAVYTQDIGDLVIFLTKSELYCVPSISFHGWPRNCVKIWDVDETTIVDLAAQEWNC